MTTAAKHQYTIPRVFFDDHISRELLPFDLDLGKLPEGVIVKSTKSTYTVVLTQDEFDELLSDAEHYSSVVWWSDDRFWFGLQCSARATVKRLRAQMTV